METRQYVTEYKQLQNKIIKDIRMAVDLLHKGHYELDDNLLFVDLQPKHYEEASRFRILALTTESITAEDVYSTDQPM